MQNSPEIQDYIISKAVGFYACVITEFNHGNVDMNIVLAQFLMIGNTGILSSYIFL